MTLLLAKLMAIENNLGLGLIRSNPLTVWIEWIQGRLLPFRKKPTAFNICSAAGFQSQKANPADNRMHPARRAPPKDLKKTSKIDRITAPARVLKMPVSAVRFCPLVHVISKGYVLNRSP
jgi:hypothetical protein